MGKYDIGYDQTQFFNGQGLMATFSPAPLLGGGSIGPVTIRSDCIFQGDGFVGIVTNGGYFYTTTTGMPIPMVGTGVAASTM